MKDRLKKGIALGLAGIFPFVFMTGCSTQVNSLSRGGFSQPEEIQSSSRGSIARFVSQVRPHRGNPDSHYRLACYYQESGDHRKAIEEFEKTLVIEPDYVQAHNRMGISYDHLKDHLRAIESYQRALRFDPQWADVLNNLGYSYLLQHRLDEALSAFQKAIALNGQEGRYHNNLGLSYALKGRLDLAMIEFQFAGDEAKAHYNLARFYHQRGEYRVAQIHYSQALALDPSFTQARVALQAVEALAGIFQPGGEKGEERADRPLESIPAPGGDLQKVAVSESPVSLKAATTGSSTCDRGKTPPTSAAFQTSSPDTKENPFSPLPKALSPETAPFGSVVSPPEGKSSARQRWGIEISNGNGVNGMAGKVSQYLKEKGLPVVRITNAQHFKHPQTRIYFQSGYQEAAVRVADQLPGFQSMEERRRFDRPDIHVKVIIGKDIPHPRNFKEDGRS